LPAAGLGTRMIPYSKEIPKEMLPIIIRDKDGYVVKPILHYIYDCLYDIGVRTFYFIIGKGKRVIEDYFTPDWDYIDLLLKKGKVREASLLNDLYNKLENSNILMINQPYPKGFGDAILRAGDFVTSDRFIVHVGDDITYPNHVENLIRMIKHFEEKNPKALLLYTWSQHPERYGVLIGEDKGEYMVVKDIVEKPSKPPSNNVVVGVYVFDKTIFRALEETKPADGGEHELTDAIKKLIVEGYEVHALKSEGIRLDIGSPEYYYEALKILLKQ